MFVRNPLKTFKSLLISVFFLAPLVVEAAARYPFVEEVRGQAWVTGKDSKRKELKGKTPLIERALLETGGASVIVVHLDPSRSFTVLENSEVLLPTISWEGGEAPVILLKSGSFRWQSPVSEKSSYNVALRSDLFEFLAPKGDFVFTISHEKAYAGVKVFKGSMEFSALNGEESTSVREGQEVGFQGVLEGGEIAYDILLKGKKIPRGRLTPVTTLSKKELSSFSSEEQKRQHALAARKAQEQKAQEELKKAGAICTSPAGKFNQCAWICLNNPKGEKKLCRLEKPGVSCVRRRCNANGQWAEEMLVDAQKSSIQCKAQPVVAPCDY